MRRLLSFFSFLLTLALLAGGGGIFYGYGKWSAPGPLSEPKTVVISRGQGVSAIAGTLAQEGVIADPLLFRVGARLTGLHRALKAGEYEFGARETMRGVFAKLAKGDIVVRKVTLREGLTSWQVTRIIGETQGLAGEVGDIPPEGTLLPETYTFTRGDSRADILNRMSGDMHRTLEELWPKRSVNSPLMSQQEALILASIVEKETGKPEERRRVASVFLNRLRLSMPLQSDPTVIYALTNGQIKDDGMGPLGRRLLRKDIEIDSHYNTYRYPGLPPGPICNPGRASLEAVLNPEDTAFLYFVADGTGGHVFSSTLKEHNDNVSRWRQIRKEQEDQ